MNLPWARPSMCSLQTHKHTLKWYKKVSRSHLNNGLFSYSCWRLACNASFLLVATTIAYISRSFFLYVVALINFRIAAEHFKSIDLFVYSVHTVVENWIRVLFVPLTLFRALEISLNWNHEKFYAYKPMFSYSFRIVEIKITSNTLVNNANDITRNLYCHRCS